MTGASVPAVTFNYAVWVARYPIFSGVSQPLAQSFFDEACLYCVNRLGPVPTTTELSLLLNMLTAHVAWLAGQGTGNPSNGAGPVGRLSDATEGSVSASFQNDYPPGTPQWYQQTQFGAAFWAATAKYRTFRYRSGIRRLPGWDQIPWLYSNTGQ